ncbi:MAG: hypothetical protein H6793_02580 [Candidatus Nomurabacteria bacterium]|nr:hypothetical protein [Candidatus Saccharibacteria bacterium]USN95200.1 MAG: hypothetical protein H6793_02580 [Candidatus Nomurabacteria bacterium]
MKNIKLIGAGLFTVSVMVLGLLFVVKGTANAQEMIQSTDQAQSSQTQQQGSVYSYVAQPGDSYSLMARKAIQTYGITNKVNLSEAQIIFAETHLTQDAGSPALVKGQKVEIKEDAVKNWVNKAKDLSAQQQSAWNVYAQNANFNTNKVGQAS